MNFFGGAAVLRLWIRARTSHESVQNATRLGTQDLLRPFEAKARAKFQVRAYHAFRDLNAPLRAARPQGALGAPFGVPRRPGRGIPAQRSRCGLRHPRRRARTIHRRSQSLRFWSPGNRDSCPDRHEQSFGNKALLSSHVTKRNSARNALPASMNYDIPHISLSDIRHRQSDRTADRSIWEATAPCHRRPLGTAAGHC